MYMSLCTLQSASQRSLAKAKENPVRVFTPWCSLRPVLAALVFFAAIGAFAKDRMPLPTHGLCDGLPRVPVNTSDGFCLGIVTEGFTFPRGLLPLDDGNILVVDMGGWGKAKGSLWRLHKTPSGYKKELLIKGLDRPHAIVKNRVGKIYLASVDKISLVRIQKSGVKLEDVIGGSSELEGLPTSGRHPLKQLAFDDSGNLFVNIGSASDNCEKNAKTKSAEKQVCIEAEGLNARGVIRKYIARLDGSFENRWEIYAKGLRNSMGMEFEPTQKVLWQVENSRDVISRADPSLNDSLLPHDELNKVSQGKTYGWPYCFDMGRASPEFPDYNCKKTESPAALLPAHSAPLGLAFHSGKDLPKSFGPGLFVTLHGYRDTGHRVIYIPLKEGRIPHSPFKEIVWGWDKENGLPKGAPVDIRLGGDGSLYVSDDRNGLILRLTYTGN
jgi:glucose/arabinose dehydrogenase